MKRRMPAHPFAIADPAPASTPTSSTKSEWWNQRRTSDMGRIVLKNSASQAIGLRE
jgi:hypothetical protein